MFYRSGCIVRRGCRWSGSVREGTRLVVLVLRGRALIVNGQAAGKGVGLLGWADVVVGMWMGMMMVVVRVCSSS